MIWPQKKSGPPRAFFCTVRPSRQAQPRRDPLCVGREPARAVEARREIEIAHAVISVVGREALVDAVDVVRRAAHRHAVAVALQQTVELCQIVDHGVERAKHMALTVDIGLFAEQGMAIAVVRDLVPLLNDALKQLWDSSARRRGRPARSRGSGRRPCRPTSDCRARRRRRGSCRTYRRRRQRCPLARNSSSVSSRTSVRARPPRHPGTPGVPSSRRRRSWRRRAHRFSRARCGGCRRRSRPVRQEHTLGKALHFFSDADEGTHVPPSDCAGAQSAA